MELVKPELYIFDDVPEQIEIEQSRYETIETITALPRSDGAPIDFRIAATEHDLLDPLVYMHLQCKISKDGKAIEAKSAAATAADAQVMNKLANAGDTIYSGDVVAPINLFLNTMWKYVDIYFNQQQVSGNQQAHCWVSYLHALLQFSTAAKTTYLEPSFWYPDQPGRHDSTDATEPGTLTNAGFKTRFKKAKNSNTLDLFGPVLVDLLRTGRPFLNKMDILMRFFRQSPQFCLMANVNDTEKYEINITRAELFIRRIRPTPAALQKLEHTLSGRPAIYPFVYHDTRIIHVPSGLTNVNQEIFEGVLPRRVTILQLQSAAFTGSYKSNPLYLVHNYLSSATLELNGRQIPSVPYYIDLKTNGLAATHYMSMFLNYNLNNEFVDIGITQDAFRNGYFILAYDITQDGSAGLEHKSPTQQGLLRLKMEFSQALTSPTVILAIGEQEKALQIDSHRNVIVS